MFTNTLDSCILSFCGHPLVSLSCLALPDDHKLFAAALLEQHKRRRATSSPAGSSASLRRLDNPVAAVRQERSWWDLSFPSEETVALFPGLQVLSSRQIDRFLVFFRHQHTSSDEPLLRDVSLGRVKETGDRGLSDCVTPHGVLLHSQLCRRFVGYEALRLQGIVNREPADSSIQASFGSGRLIRRRI
jgi:hypothetical protein